MSAGLGLPKHPFSWKKNNPCASYAGEEEKTSGKKQDYPRGEKTPPPATPLWLQEDNQRRCGEQRDVPDHLSGSRELPDPWQQRYLTSGMGKSSAVVVEGSRAQPQLGLKMPLR